MKTRLKTTGILLGFYMVALTSFANGIPGDKCPPDNGGCPMKGMNISRCSMQELDAMLSSVTGGAKMGPEPKLCDKEKRPMMGKRGHGEGRACGNCNMKNGQRKRCEKPGFMAESPSRRDMRNGRKIFGNFPRRPDRMNQASDGSRCPGMMQGRGMRNQGMNRRPDMPPAGIHMIGPMNARHMQRPGMVSMEYLAAEYPDQVMEILKMQKTGMDMCRDSHDKLKKLMDEATQKCTAQRLKLKGLIEEYRKNGDEKTLAALKAAVAESYERQLKTMQGRIILEENRIKEQKERLEKLNGTKAEKVADIFSKISAGLKKTNK